MGRPVRIAFAINCIQLEFQINYFINWSEMQKKTKETVNYVSKLDKQVFNEDLENSFACECGKSYWTFPALYLHFQRSHKIKISTKIKEEGCVISKVGKVRTFTYFFSKEKQKDTEQSPRQSLLTQLFTQFSNSLENQWDRYPALFLCSRFQKYLHEEESFKEIDLQMLKISSIPNYFNEFMISSQPLMKTEDVYNFNCDLLLRLGKWLNFKGYSNLKIEYSQETSIKTQTDSAGQASDSI